MQTRLGRTIILVDNYDRAFEFYETNFFCKKLFDSTTSSGQRLMHIAFSDDDKTGIWFLKADGYDQEQKIGKQTAGQPTLVIYTNDVEELYYHVQANGTQIIDPLASARDSRFFHCLDLYGNRLTVVELPL
jgi:predicted enzyme related to lactoylglutathione lyase